MPRISAEAKEERRQRFIDAAWRAAAAKGYHSLTIDEVCTEAGVSKGSFYAYFSDKADLLVALLETDATRLEALIEQLDKADVSGADRLAIFVRAVLGRNEDPGQVQIRADLWAEMLTNEDVRDRFVAAVQRRRRLLQRWIEAAVSSRELVDVPPRALSSIVIALADGLALHNAIDPTAFRWGNVRKALESILEGISRQ